MLYQVIIVLHILLGLGIIGLVLMQQGKGADAGAAFGSGASGSVFGAQGSASFLSRTTAIFATLFFVTSLTLAFLSGFHSKAPDLIDTIVAEPLKSADVPAVPVTVTPNTASDSAVAIEKIPEAPVIKEVEKAPAAPKKK